jgi:hypothetical protein
MIITGKNLPGREKTKSKSSMYSRRSMQAQKTVCRTVDTKLETWERPNLATFFSQ